MRLRVPLLKQAVALKCIIILQRMRCRVMVVILCVCVCVSVLSVTKLTATYLACEAKGSLWHSKGMISPKMLCLPVLASFADSKLLDFAIA